MTFPSCGNFQIFQSIFRLPHSVTIFLRQGNLWQIFSFIIANLQYQGSRSSADRSVWVLICLWSCSFVTPPIVIPLSELNIWIWYSMNRDWQTKKWLNDAFLHLHHYLSTQPCYFFVDIMRKFGKRRFIPCIFVNIPEIKELTDICFISKHFPKTIL